MSKKGFYFADQCNFYFISGTAVAGKRNVSDETQQALESSKIEIQGFRGLFHQIKGPLIKSRDIPMNCRNLFKNAS